MSGPRYTPTEVAAALGASSVKFLGAGAFGDTWRAGDTAVKIICEDGYPPERVVREVSGLQRVTSDYVVNLLSAGTVILGGKERPALTFEYVAGGDLEQVLTEGSLPDSREVDSLLVGLLSGLQDMHAADATVHRDIKPPNIALRDGDWARPVILDLGLARSMTEATLTVYPGRLGTATFMAPEQIRGERARKAADLFAVGVTVLTVATGTHPFYGADQTYTWDEALAQIAAGPKPLPATLSKQARTVLERLVHAEEFERGSASSNLRRMEQRS